MLVKIHNAYRTVVAVCDKELIGKSFQENQKQLDLTGDFFRGEEKTKEEMIEILDDMRKEDASFNIVGKKSCEIAKQIGLINEEGIIYIESVPVALVLL
ncbi:MAG: DUF424 family protein [Nanoarchaeota archaeon]